MHKQSGEKGREEGEGEREGRTEKGERRQGGEEGGNKTKGWREVNWQWLNSASSPERNEGRLHEIVRRNFN